MSRIEVAEIAWAVSLGLCELFVAAWPRSSSTTWRRLSNVCMTVVNHLAIPAVTVPVILWLHRQGLDSGIAASWPLALSLAATFVTLDLAGYWFHRISHRVDVLWRFHQIHHLDEDFDFTTGLRVHTGEEIMHQLLQVAIVVALGIPASAYLIFRTAAFLAAIFHHSNLRLPIWLDRGLGWFVMTPAMHVPHHHEMIEDTDSNFGFIFPWWDRLFGTFNSNVRQPHWRIGLDYAADLNFVGLLVEPFLPTMLKDRRSSADMRASAPQMHNGPVNI